MNGLIQEHYYRALSMNKLVETLDEEGNRVSPILPAGKKTILSILMEQ